MKKNVNKNYTDFKLKFEDQQTLDTKGYKYNKALVSIYLLF